MTARLSCGHAPSPTPIGTGYASLPDGRRVCYPCAETIERDDMSAAESRYWGYVSADGRRVTTWSGGELARVTRLTRNRRQTFIRAVDRDGRYWSGIGPAESGTYVNLRRVKGASS